MSREVVTTTREHATDDVRVSLLGAWRTVTGAMTRLDTARGSLLVDCGVAQGRERRDAPDLDAARDVDAVVLTHGHPDHVGSLPSLFAAGFAGPVLGTRATLAIAEINLRDGIRLEGGSEGDVRRFVAAFQRRARRIRYDVPVAMGELELTLRDAGHILGSASVEIGAPKTGASS